MKFYDFIKNPMNGQIKRIELNWTKYRGKSLKLKPFYELVYFDTGAQNESQTPF